MKSLLPLSGREKQVLRLICDGCSNKQIATKLRIQPSTVDSYVVNIFRKIGANNRANAAFLAIKQKMLT